MRDQRLLIWSIILLSTGLLGEMKITPFGDDFRFSLGIMAYFFGLLLFSVPVLATGISVGAFVVLFRISLGLLLYDTPVLTGFTQHMPVFFYYVTFAAIISLLKIKANVEYHVKVALYGALADMASNVAELIVRIASGAPASMSYHEGLLIILVGLLRSFFAVGMCNMLAIRQVRAQAEQRRLELERLMMINSDLFEEAFYLRKSMSHIEEITRESYQLYQSLKQRLYPDATQALQIAKHVHELKKDSERILSGLFKIIHQERMLSKRIQITELCAMVVRANTNYSLLLGKQIQWGHCCNINLSTTEIYPLLSVLNNIVSNAVEAIPHDGKIDLQVDLQDDSILFAVVDNGPGISADDLELIFHPGYTTKFDAEGNSSTGIGLSHATDIVQLFKGDIDVTSAPGYTCFHIRIPVERLT
ncbi:ATP-binding protein [Paenibacillus alvei]|uniref:ATP-binding protein n=1 Tax=Paenibacillus alvei TaxID=44250 RepID=UPI0002895F53|nr:ATP-binding protein [Paenibacillus alvei]EJW19741.1 sensor histidine kinase GlnK [Paenibacillus alvei DSM 29]MCY9541797.1 ATP-binding protein [Paenibacillus alvei]MCY9705016.1 ATP-binding protein [Paenibacillus alvei]MEC0082506.1 ATP-binding protein [Paenibacillus alvei]